MRFIHTADWQLGLKLRYIDSERAAHLRLMRFQTVRKIAKVAIEEKAEFVLVAGDIFDDNGVGRDTLQWAYDVLKDFGDIPVILLPGNHDAATEDSALRRLQALPNVHLALTREPIQLPGAAIYPCPLMRRHEREDPTAWLPARQAGEGIRIALAHGGVINFAPDAETPNLISAEAIIEKGFDYVALGDWHGTLRYNDRVWYSGAHEATRFKESDPGNILLVDIAQEGAVPQVTKLPVHEAMWHSWDVEFSHDAQVEELGARIEALPGVAASLLELNLAGSLSLPAHDRLDRMLAEFSSRLAYLRCDSSAVASAPTAEDLAQMRGEGFVAEALDQLREGNEPQDAEAIRLLFRLQQEAQNAVA